MQSLLSLGNVKPNSITAQNILIIQIQKIYIPLAHQIGLYDLKRELEDMYMKIVNPNKYAKLHQLIQPEISPTILHSMIEAMCKTLSNEGLSVSIKNRHKGIYSTWQKMLKQNLEYEEVYDSFGIRIIILNISIEEEKLMCWQVYKIITNMYLVNPNKARNWLENPKKNGYQSLHLLILGENDKWMEVQIRSERMHKLAEDGDAAHWLYKNKSMHIDTYEKLFITSLKNQLLLLKNS